MRNSLPVAPVQRCVLRQPFNRRPRLYKKNLSINRAKCGQRTFLVRCINAFKVQVDLEFFVEMKPHSTDADFGTVESVATNACVVSDNTISDTRELKRYLGERQLTSNVQ